MKTGLRFSQMAVLCFSASLIATTAMASSIAITGTADKGYARDDNFSISGPGLTLYATAPDGPSDVSLSPCPPGITLQCGLVIQANPGFQVPYVYSGGSLNGVSADYLLGSLTFSPAPEFPTTPIPNGSNVSGPVTVSGDIIGVNLTSPGNNPGPPLFNVMISGTGTLTADTMHGCATASCSPSDVAFTGFDFTFSGTASSTPEPASVILLATGMLGLGVIELKRRAKPLK